MKLLLFAGAGSSVELGVPAMAGMAREFGDHTRQWNVEPDLVAKIMGANEDVEHLLEEIDRLSNARAALQAMDTDVAKLDRVDKIRAEIEWFVQHVAERVTAHDAELMWGSVLRACASHEIVFVTTNYDRAIELAANSQTIKLRDGYGDFAEGEVAVWQQFGSATEKPKLVKLHGSTDWYVDVDGTAVKLRHPMPLFGRGSLRLSDGHELQSALVLPSREKLMTRNPYPRLTQAFLDAIDTCDCAVMLGTSMRDEHVRNASLELGKQRPIVVVNPDSNGYDIPNAVVIGQAASQFLVSTLPEALAGEDVVDSLQKWVGRPSPATSGKGCFGLLKTALNRDSEIEIRCTAIEELEQIGIRLDDHLVSRLLDDPDEAVARYTLGLVALSCNRARQLEIARRSRHALEATFAAELRILEAL